MPRFIINKNAQQNGDHEIHNASTGCVYMPTQESQIDLGMHLTCHSAVVAAKQRWPSNHINGCYYCSNPCHTS